MITKPEIYTPEFILSEVSGMLQKLKDDKDLIFKGQLFEDKNYSRQRFSEWLKESTNPDPERTPAVKALWDEISDTIGKIDEILENRAVVGGLTNKFNAQMTKFHLINNYDWKDKQGIEHSGAVDTSSDSLREIAAAATALVKSNEPTSPQTS